MKIHTLVIVAVALAITGLQSISLAQQIGWSVGGNAGIVRFLENPYFVPELR